MATEAQIIKEEENKATSCYNIVAYGNLSKSKIKLIKDLFKALEIGFKENIKIEEESPYDPEFVKKIEKGRKAMRKGKGIKIELDDIWK